MFAVAQAADHRQHCVVLSRGVGEHLPVLRFAAVGVAMHVKSFHHVMQSVMVFIHPVRRGWRDGAGFRVRRPSVADWSAAELPWAAAGVTSGQGPPRIYASSRSGVHGRGWHRWTPAKWSARHRRC